MNKKLLYEYNIFIFFFFFFFFLFFEIFEIFTDATGAFEGIFFSSLYIFAFLATNDLFFLISIISNNW